MGRERGCSTNLGDRLLDPSTVTRETPVFFFFLTASSVNEIYIVEMMTQERRRQPCLELTFECTTPLKVGVFLLQPGWE